MEHYSEPHFNGADTNGDGFLDLAEITAHAEAKIEELEGSSTKTKARKK